MDANRNEHDEALAKILEALRTAAPPEGMDARIAQRLQKASAQPAAPRWRDFAASLVPSSDWARGAITGAAAALFIAVAIFFISHLNHPRADRPQIAIQSSSPSQATPVSYPLNSSPVRATAAPCSNASRTREIADIRPSDDPLAAIHAPSHPAPELGLTQQERELVRLVQTADPKQLAALNSEAQTHSQSDEDAQFEKFFAPPPVPKPDPEPDELTASTAAQEPSPSSTASDAAPTANNNE